MVEVIRVHDEIEKNNITDYKDNILLKLFNEVDSLAAIDMSLGLPSFSKDKLLNWLLTGPYGMEPLPDGRYQKVKDKGRVQHFITKFSKNEYKRLSKEFIKYAASKD